MRALTVVAGLLAAGCGAAARPPPLGPPSDVNELSFPLAGAAHCSRGYLPGERHFALDIPAAAGTPVLASAAGIVVRASRHPVYGLAAIVRHAGFTYTLYAHLSALAVAAGDRVEAGEKIGEVGRSGNASGAHLHWEVLRAPADLPLRANGALGIPGDAYRVDPASVAAVPPDCRGL